MSGGIFRVVLHVKLKELRGFGIIPVLSIYIGKAGI
jgi:hypothetical protein